MSDYISREAFIADCEGRYCAPCKEQGKDANGVRCRACWVDDMLSEVMDAPPPMWSRCGTADGLLTTATAEMKAIRHTLTCIARNAALRLG